MLNTTLNKDNKMYTILPIHNDQMPESFLFETVELAIEGAKKDFNSPHSPDTKGFMIVSIEKVIGITKTLNEDVTLEDFTADPIPEATGEVTATTEVDIKNSDADTDPSNGGL